MCSTFEELDIFRTLGDALHNFATFHLLLSIIKKKSYDGVSAKTQFLYTLVFTTRYLDLFVVFLSYYNSVMKVIFALVPTCTFLLVFKMKSTYEKKYDSFWSEVLVAGALILAVFVNYNLEAIEVLWTFSNYLEAVVMIPQLYMIFQSKKTTRHMKMYISFLVLYKIMYICDSIYVYNTYNQFNAITGISNVVNITIVFIAVVIWRCSKIIHKYKQKDVMKWKNIFLVSGSFAQPETIKTEAPLVTEHAYQPVVD
ncbi:ER lumen protein-retaining receptor 3-like [Diabrotica undecimpunctata]|uniref:ER lumen protein-retaining receptor 3-like n=1 Tax=Diabrotica undecimpunctata TaxID=50387 RepID=UPI003B63E414